MAQIQVFADTPVSLVSGELVLDLNPAVFGPVASVDVFSAAGDQVGTANVQNRHIDAQFKSITGGVGRLPGLPVLTVVAPVLPTAAVGTVSTITASSGSVAWKDAQNVTYSVTPFSGTLTVGGSLSIGSITTGGGLLPAGTVVHIDGTGFTSATQVSVAGVALTGVQTISAEEIDVTLAAPADLTGRRVLAQNADGAAATFYSALHATNVQQPTSGPFANIQPVFPQQLYAAAPAGSFAFGNQAMALRNPNLDSVNVLIKTVTTSLNGAQATGTTVTLPPGGVFVAPGSQFASGIRSQIVLVPAEPIQMALIDPQNGGTALVGIPVPVLQAYGVIDGNSQTFPGTQPVTWNWATGTPAPSPITMAMVLNDIRAPFTASIQSDRPWVSVSPAQGTTCNNLGFPPAASSCPAASQITLTVDPSGLTPGVYNATLTVTVQAFGGMARAIPLLLNVSATQQIFVERTDINYGAWTQDSTPQSVPVHLSSNAGALPFSVTVTTQSGKNWLTASPLSGSTPATLTITAAPGALPATGDTGIVTVKGPSNSASITVEMQTANPIPPAFNPLPESIVFSVGAGQAAPSTQRIGFSAVLATSPFTVAAQTSDGSKWLSASIQSGPGVPGVIVAANQAGLSAGTYHGTVTIASILAAEPAVVPVTLVVWTAPPPVTVSPATLSFNAATRSASASQTIDVATGNIPMYWNVAAITSDGVPWLIASVPSVSPLFQEIPTPFAANVFADATTLAPGVYHGTLKITAPANSTNAATVAVTLTVTPGSAPLPIAGTVPLVSSVLNGASQLEGGVSPGEIMTLFGQNIGPATPAGFTIGADGKAATMLSGLQLLFDGVPAPLLYASASQLNAIVPYEVAGKAVTNLQLQFNGATIPAGGLPVVPSAPAIFSVDSAGVGAAAVLNQDNTINSSTNAAARGSVIQIYATGEGATAPNGIPGEITGADTKRPLLPVTVTIGGIQATVVYQASAPDAVSGLFQVNAVVPDGITPGPAVPVVLRVGSQDSSPAVTIAAK
jgi:uncharacterized protein (TIGR03437 family)